MTFEEWWSETMNCNADREVVESYRSAYQAGYVACVENVQKFHELERTRNREERLSDLPRVETS